MSPLNIFSIPCRAVYPESNTLGFFKVNHFLGRIDDLGWFWWNSDPSHFREEFCIFEISPSCGLLHLGWSFCLFFWWDCVSASANCLSAVFLSFVVEALLVQFSGLFWGKYPCVVVVVCPWEKVNLDLPTPPSWTASSGAADVWSRPCLREDENWGLPLIARCSAGGGVNGRRWLSLSYWFEGGCFLICQMCRSHSASFWNSFRGNCSICSHIFDVSVGRGDLRSLPSLHLGRPPIPAN